MFQIPPAVHLHNIVEQAPQLGTGPDTLLRIPEKLRVQLNENALSRAFNSSGCEVRFRLKEPTFKIQITAIDVGAAQFGGGLAQVLFGDFSHTYFPVTVGKNEISCTYPAEKDLGNVSNRPLFHPHLVRILLPTHASICGLELEGDFSAPEQGDVPSRRVLHYGSSITQGAGSLSSDGTWAFRCARALGADLINLGLGGGCHCEPAMTDYLCDREDFDFAVIETGINMGGMEKKEADSNIQNLIRKFTAAHPDKPVFFLGVFPCNDDLNTNYQGRMQEFRDLVRMETAALNRPQVHYIDCAKALDPRTGLTSDLVHPSPEGMIQIGEYVSTEIKKRM